MARIEASEQQVQAARDWAADCEWEDSAYLEEYSDEEIVRGVARHYDGGWEGFVKAL